MSSTFSLYRPIAPPQSYTHACQARLLSPHSCDLITVSHSHITVFNINQTCFDRSGETSYQSCRSNGGQTDRETLRRIFQTSLFGTVEGVAAVRLPGWNRDALVLSYPHSKLSLVAWDPLAYNLVTMCIWSQDEEVVEKEREKERASAAHKSKDPNNSAAPQKTLAPALLSQVKKYIPPVLRTDPSNRCIAYYTYDCFLHVFDLSTHAALPKSDNAGACQTGLTVSASGSASFYAHAPSLFTSMDGVGIIPSLATPATFSLSALGLGSITDMQFLHGFEDPTLLVLHEKKRTWEGRYAAARLTQELTCVTFHPAAGTFSLIGNVPLIPHDTFALYPIPMPLGGALLFAQNTIAHWNNNSLDYALTTNDIGSAYVGQEKVAHVENSSVICRLDLSRAIFLSTYSDKATMFLATHSGEACLLHLYPSGGSVKSMQLESLGMVSVPEGIVKLTNPTVSPQSLMNTFSSSSQHNINQANLPSFLFLYSRLGPSLVIEYRRAREEDRKAESIEEREEEAADEAARKREQQEKQQAAAAAASTAAPMDTDVKPNRSLTSALEAAANSETKPEPGDEPAAKRSKLDEMYQAVSASSIDDELMDVFGFGRKGEVHEPETVKTEAPAPVTEEDEAKQAEAMQVREAADKEIARLARLDRAFRTKKEILFFIRDRLISAAPASDLSMSYALPRSEEDAREEQEFNQTLEDEAEKRREVDAPKAETEEQERQAAEKEKKEMEVLERRWREKERKSRVVELMQLTGTAQSGSILLATEGLLPDVVTASPFQRKVTGCWCVKQTTPQKSKKRRPLEEVFHTYLLVSTPSTTIVIHSAAELAELTSGHAFFTGRTIYAANTIANRDGSRLLTGATTAASADDTVEGIVQVYRNGFRLIQNGALVKEWTAPASLSIDLAQVESSIVLLKMSDASIRLLEVVSDQNGKLTLSDAVTPSLSGSSPISAAYLFRDASQSRALKQGSVIKKPVDSNGAAAMEVEDELSLAMSSSSSAPSSSAATSSSTAANGADEMDDLERLLGGGEPSEAFTPAAAPAPTAATAAAPAAAAVPTVPADHYLVIARGENIEFYSFPSLSLVYYIARLPTGKRILSNTLRQDSNGTTNDPFGFPLSSNQLPPIVDLFVDFVSDNATMPALFAFLDNGDLLAYQGFVPEAAQVKQLRFVKIDAPLLSRPFQNDKSSAVSTDKTYRDAFGVARTSHRSAGTPSRFQKFSHLAAPGSAAKSGVLVAGTKPYMFLLERGSFRYHAFVVDSKPRNEEEGLGGISPLEEEEDIEPDEEDANEEKKSAEDEEVNPNERRKIGLVCAASFHNPNCIHGLIYFDTHGTMFMANLQPASKLPMHPLYLPDRRLEKWGLKSSVVSAVGGSAALAGSISPSLTSFDYDSVLLTRSIHLGATPCFIARHIPTSTTVVVLSYPQRLPSTELDSDRSLPVYENRYELVVLSPSWDILARYKDFSPHEMVLCMAPIRMNKKIYIVMGTSEFMGEDHSSRGRIILIDLFFTIGNSSVLDANGQTQQIKILKMKVNTQAEKLPVSNICQMAHNILVTAQGAKLIFYRHTGKILAGVAFWDCQTYITSVICLNQFVLYGDMKRGLHLLYYDPILKTVQQLGMSNEPFHVTACDYLIDTKNLNLVCADQQGNIQMFRFSPNTPSAAANKIQLASYENPQVAQHPQSTQTLKESLYTGTSLLGGSGYKLNLKNDFHVGERIGKMVKLKMRNKPTTGATLNAGLDEKIRQSMSNGMDSPNKLTRQLSASAVSSTQRPVQSYVLMASYSGSYSQLMPIDQMVFRRLSTLLVQMSTSLPQLGGLNPLAFRLFQAGGPYHPHFAKKILDATLLFQYPNLDIEEQWRLAKQIGTTPAQIIENLKWVIWSSQLH